MILTVSDQTNSFVQFLTVLILFVGVLVLTYFVSRWIAGYEKQKMVGTNMEVIESFRLSNNKLIQIVRLGEKYLAIAVCKDTVTVLTEIPEEQLNQSSSSSVAISTQSFKELLQKATGKQVNNLGKSDDQTDDSRLG